MSTVGPVVVPGSLTSHSECICWNLLNVPKEKSETLCQGPGDGELLGLQLEEGDDVLKKATD